MQATFKSLITMNLSQLIDAKSLHEWKEILAYCVTYSTDTGKQLANELGRELREKRNDLDAAVVCFIVAGNFDSALELWDRRLRAAVSKSNRRERAMLFQRAFEKILTLKTIAKNYDTNDTFDDFITYGGRILILVGRRYADLLAANNVKALALKYIELAGHKKEKLWVLKERIVGSNPRAFARNYGLSKPIYPVVDIRVSSASAAISRPSTAASIESSRQPYIPAPAAFVQPRPFATTAPVPAPVPHVPHGIAGPFARPVPVLPRPQQPIPKLQSSPAAVASPHPIPPPIARPEMGGRKIFYPVPQTHSATAVPPPPMAPPQGRSPHFVAPPPRVPPAPPRPAAHAGSPPATEEKKDFAMSKRVSGAMSPVPPPPPAVVMPSATPTSIIKGTPPPMKGRFLEQANFGIRPFKHDVFIILLKVLP